MRKLILALLALPLVILPLAANAASTTSQAQAVATCGTPPHTYSAGQVYPITQDTTGSTCVSATVSASVSPFAPNGNQATMSVSNVTSSLSLPAGTTVLVSNIGTTNTAYITLSSGAGSATTASIPVPPGGAVGLAVGSNDTINAITASSTTSLNLAGGTGLVAGFGGGGGGTGGTVAIDQTTPGTTNGVVVNSGTITSSSTIIGPVDANGNVQNVPVDSGGTNMTRTSDHSLNVNVTNNGVTAGTTATGATYAPVAGLSQTSCNAASNTNAQLNPPNIDLKGNTCTKDASTAVNGDSTTSHNFGVVGAAAATNCNTQTYTNAQENHVVQDLAGNLCVKTIPQVGSFVSGTADQATGGTDTTLISAVTSKVIYVTAFSCINSGASTSVISFKDNTAGTVIYKTIAPAGGGSNLSGGGQPLFKSVSGDPIVFNPATSSTTVSCSASGYSQ